MRTSCDACGQKVGLHLRGTRRGREDNLHRLQLRQHCETFPHRASFHHRHRRGALPHLFLSRLPRGGHKPPRRLGNAVRQTHRCGEEVVLSRRDILPRRILPQLALRQISQRGGERPLSRRRSESVVQENRGRRQRSDGVFRRVQGNHDARGGQDLRPSENTLRQLCRRELLQRQDAAVPGPARTQGTAHGIGRREGGQAGRMGYAALPSRQGGRGDALRHARHRRGVLPCRDIRFPQMPVCRRLSAEPAL